MSNDALLGNVNNVLQFYVLQCILANECGLKVGDYNYTMEDYHLYSNQFDVARELLDAEELPTPKLIINYKKDFFDYVDTDFNLEGELNTKSYKVGVAIWECIF